MSFWGKHTKKGMTKGGKCAEKTINGRRQNEN
jgi:hypothetical protein